jgi:hypothetical protein
LGAVVGGEGAVFVLDDDVVRGDRGAVVVGDAAQVLLAPEEVALVVDELAVGIGGIA